MPEAAAPRSLDPLSRLAALLLVESSERSEVAYFLGLFCLLGAGLALGRGSADALFFKRYGIDYLPWMLMAVGVSLSVVSTLYAAYCDTVSPERLLRYIFAGLAGALLLNGLLMSAGVSAAYPAYFVLYEVASEVLLVHGSHYLSQNLDTLKFKRLAPVTFAGVQLGGMAGGLGLAGLVQLFGVEAALPAWGALLVAALLLTERHHRRRGGSPHFRRGRRTPALAQVGEGFRHLRESQLLRLLSLAFFFLVVAFFSLSYAVNRVYTETFADEAALTTFYGYLAFTLGLSTVLLQLLVSGRVMRRMGTLATNLIYPVAMLASFILLLVSFTVPFAVIASFNKDALMQAFRNPSFNLFYGALPGHMQARARALSLVVVLPAALVTCGILLLAAQQASPSTFLYLGVAVAALLLFFSVRMNRAYAGALIGTLREKVAVAATAGAGDEPAEDAAGRLLRLLAQGDATARSAADTLMALYPRRAAELLLPALGRLDGVTAVHIVDALARQGLPGLAERLRPLLGGSDDRLEAALLRALIALRDEAVAVRLPALLADASPRLRAVAIHGIWGNPLAPQGAADAAAENMLGNWREEDLAAVLEILEQAPNRLHPDRLLPLLDREEPALVAATLRILAHAPRPPDGIAVRLSGLLEHPDREVRCAAVAVADGLAEPARGELLLRALGDEPRVGQLAAERLVPDLEAAAQAAKQLLSPLSPRARAALLLRLVEIRAPVALLQAIAERMADDAHLFAAARSRLSTEPQPGRGVRLLLLVVEERLHHCIDMSLLALRGAAEPGTIEVVRAALRSGDPRHTASAVEALHAMRGEPQAGRLARLLEGLRGGTAPREAVALSEVIRRCREYPDPWLARCARFAAGGTEA